MAEYYELAHVIIDPGHERYGQVGEIDKPVGSYGIRQIKFPDGGQAEFNDEYLSGIPQFKALLKSNKKQINHLVNALPWLRPTLQDFFDSISEPDRNRSPEAIWTHPTETTINAKVGALALIDTVIKEVEE